MKKKKKRYDDDDGRTIIDMNVEGMPWYVPNRSEKKADEEYKPKRKEFFAMLGGAFRAYLPVFLTMLIGITAAFLLAYVWFRGWTL